MTRGSAADPDRYDGRAPGYFAETREQLGGYFLIDARDLDEAIAVAGRIPGARKGADESGREVVVR